MKKALAIILVLTLVLASAVTVFADENTATIESANDPNNYFERDVNIKIIPATGGATVYNVKFSWDSLDFTYKYRDSGTWNPENHTYTNTIEADWQGNTTATINVENHSNAPVKIISQFERVTIPDGAVFTEDTINNTKTLVYKGVTGVMTNVLFNLAGVAGTGNEAVVDSDTITITVSGTPTVNTDFRFDEIRISVAPGV